MEGPAYKHLDEARRDTVTSLKRLLSDETEVERAVIIQDLFGRFRAIFWLRRDADAAELRGRIDQELREAGRGYWTGDLWMVDQNVSHSDRLVYDDAWNESVPLTNNLRLDDRHRNRTAWFTRPRQPPWPTQTDESGKKVGPPIVVFSSFKGGVGRTTSLASFAIQRARSGESVVVIDFDLDAPGVGVLLGSDSKGTTAPWGVVDYVLERALGEVPFKDPPFTPQESTSTGSSEKGEADLNPSRTTDIQLQDHYIHRCSREGVTGDGAIMVMPAGILNDDYLSKLSRIDLEIHSGHQQHPLDLLLEDVRSDLNPAWILIDARAGLSPAAGLLLSGLAHLYVLFSTTSTQSLYGLERMVHHLGFDRLKQGLQADILVAQAMVPDNTITGLEAQREFAVRVEAILRDHYYLRADDDPDDQFWSMRDIDNREAPHVPVSISYRETFAFFRSIDDIATLLAEDPVYRELDRRIRARFPGVDELAD
jgi:hypothetical protein